MKFRARVVECAGNYSDGYIAIEIVMDQHVYGLGKRTVFKMPAFAYERIEIHLGGKEKMLEFFDEIVKKINH
jgi:hypothetical protein